MMKGELDELYQSVILDHNRAPRNCRRLDDASGSARGRNPSCGDEVVVFVRDDDGVLADVSFEGTGCAISRASASLMTLSVKGKTRGEALALFEQFHALVTGETADRASLGKLAVFSGVRSFPARVKCASLAWHALRSALESPPALQQADDSSSNSETKRSADAV